MVTGLKRIKSSKYSAGSRWLMAAGDWDLRMYDMRFYLTMLIPLTQCTSRITPVRIWVYLHMYVRTFECDLWPGLLR